MDKDLAVKDRTRFSIENALVNLMAGTVRVAVIEQRMGIGVLARADEVQAINPAFGPRLIESDVDVMAGKLGAERHGR